MVDTEAIVADLRAEGDDLAPAASAVAEGRSPVDEGAQVGARAPAPQLLTSVRGLTPPAPALPDRTGT